MDKKKPKNQPPGSLLREPKAKKTLGLKVPVIQMPHLELVQKHTESAPDDPTLPSQTRQPRQTSHTSMTSQSSQTHRAEKAKDVAPKKDFQKVPNSHTKKAIPEGYFKPGKSKHLYDVLYSLTRGAIEPQRSIRISKTKLMKKAGIGSRITFDSIIADFEASGLVRVRVFSGEHAGNEFEVFTYDELDTLPSHTSQTSMTSHAQNLDRLVSLETSQTSHSLNAANKETSANPKTFFKTMSFSIDDDAPIRTAFEKLNTAARAATGRNLTQKDWEGFTDIIEILINETSVAKSRTRSVSTYLKFAAENLRRRLYATNDGGQRKKSASGEKSWAEVGKKDEESGEYDEQGNFLPKKLDEEERNQALKILNDYRKWGAPVEDSERFYVAEDWKWLMEKLADEDKLTEDD